MKVPRSFLKNIPPVVSLLFILLFVYGAVSKFLDFQNFQVQIGQSPILNSFTGFISVFILFIEFLIAFFLSIKKLRIMGLYLALALMTLFSLYIYFILNYSPFVPCSCGGVLEDLGWKSHLVFNLFFVFLACISLYISRENKTAIILRICGVILLCAIVMVFLIISSESISHNRNNFIRSFPPFPAKLVKSEDLKFNSYYFAGEHEGNIYLGNRSAPALITEMDTSLKIIRKYQIQISDTLLDFHNIKLSVNPPYFFLYDGTVPCFFKGYLKNSRAILKTTTIPGFTKAVIIDSSTAIIRTLNENGENLMARIDLENGRVQYTDSTFLQKQIDGLFDTDGILQYSPDQQKFVYLYYYRNEYLVSDKNLNLVKRGHTIDTNTQAKIKTEYIESTKERKFSAPPYLSEQLQPEFGSGFSVRQINLYRQFYRTFENVHTLYAQLSWSQYKLLLSFGNQDKRGFYIAETIKNNWTVRQLERQIYSNLYERLLLSNDKESVLAVAKNEKHPSAAKEIIKDPMFLEFLGLKREVSYYERDLESAIITHLQEFLLELGNGFSFVARQKRLHLDGDEFFVDLVFYNRLLQCFVIIEIKTTKLTHQDIGQLQMYVNYYDRIEKLQHENPTIGILLCANKNDAVVKFTLPENQKQIIASQYELYLPTEKQLLEEVNKELESFEEKEEG